MVVVAWCRRAEQQRADGGPHGRAVGTAERVFWANCGTGACGACEAGTYRTGGDEERRCLTCPGGKVPSLGACFPGTAYESIVYDGAITHAREVRAFGESCYYFGEGIRYWTSAERKCHELGGHLVCLGGRREAKFVADTFSDDWSIESFWVGLSERGNEKSFTWTNPRCCSDYRNWFESVDSDSQTTREPKEDTELESYRCVRSDSDAKLHDENCRSKRPFVCEAPVTMAATTCAPCRKGTFSTTGAVECQACAWGRYASADGSDSCTPCPATSPAALLVAQFGQNGAVQCGGSLGRPQRAAYIAVSVATAVGPGLLAAGVMTAQFVVGATLARRGFAAWPTRDAEWRTKIVTFSGTAVFTFGVVGGAVVANWLKPIRQNAEDWPYKGRLAATTEEKGCDPARRYPYFVTGMLCLAIVASALVASIPVVDLLAVLRAIHDRLVSLRLRRKLRGQMIKWKREREQQDEALNGVVTSFGCTLCGQGRADALNMPCGHQFFCVDCARTFVEENGDVCNACRQPSELHDVQLRRSTLRTRRAPTRPTRPPPAQDSRLLLFGAGGAGAGVSDAASVEVELRTFDRRTASVRDLRAAIAATKRVRAGARQRFLASTCGGCALAKLLVVDIPCGHATLCAECAATYRAIHGNVCSRCGEAADLQEPVLEQSCSVCFDVVSAQYLVALGSCGHQICTACSIGYVRSALANVAEQVTAAGMRCPLGGSKYSTDTCDGVVTKDVVERLVARDIRPDLAADVLPLRADELDRLLRFMYEASIKIYERFYCCWADCSRLFAVEHRDHLTRYGAPPTDSVRRAPKLIFQRLRTAFRTAPPPEPQQQQQQQIPRASPASTITSDPGDVEASGREDDARGGSDDDDDDEERGASEAPLVNDDDDICWETTPPFVSCPWCGRQSCLRCKVPAHSLLTCKEVKTGGPGVIATTLFVEATSKPCPQCSFRITHHHGHACHHIRPGTGCLNCGTHFCYRCLRRGTSGTSCGCRLFCQNSDIVNNIERLPYPHDRRCGCPFCADCREGAPCPQCTGGCVVCRGLVPPGPLSFKDLESWGPDLSGRASAEETQYACVATLSGHKRAVASVSWSRDGLRLLSTSADATAKVWRSEPSSSSSNAWSCATSLVGHGEGLNDATWWRDSARCATASDDKTVRLWDVETGSCVVTYEGHESYVFCVDVNPQNTLLASGSFDETVKCWDARCERAIKTINAHSDPVTGVSFNKRDGTIIASSSYDGLLRLWDTALGECLATIFAEMDGETHSKHAAVSHVVYAPNGNFVLSANHDSTLRLWRVASPPCAHAKCYEGLEAARFCGACAFHASPDRRGDPKNHAVVSGSEDGRLVVWNLQTAAIEHSIPAHDDAVLAVDPHPREDLVATGGMTRDALVKLWRWQETDDEEPPDDMSPPQGRSSPSTAAPMDDDAPGPLPAPIPDPDLLRINPTPDEIRVFLPPPPITPEQTTSSEEPAADASSDHHQQKRPRLVVVAAAAAAM
ncbi:hypothetical protein CTAYLR_004077 [Chrysophaeum taylorii]|uniref:Uncharacterized protein n=1 Tax=Chrysophaeum taylorii TaxID=2483200 RepID=A0AAD7UPB8_9STRA|nr:hypothetical protein CTAYLR_004077 [Chrysophaeum taylorii]